VIYVIDEPWDVIGVLAIRQAISRNPLRLALLLPTEEIAEESVILEERFMNTSTVEVRLKLTEEVTSKMRTLAEASGVTEEVIVERAFELFASLDKPSVTQDYWFSVGSMKEDWDDMPDDWMIDEVKDALSSG
jgi:hypothetical protein